MKPTAGMTVEQLEETKIFWIQELQRSFFPEYGVAEYDTGTCEAYIRCCEDFLSAAVAKSAQKQIKSQKFPLPFDINNPLPLDNDQDE